MKRESPDIVVDVDERGRPHSPPASPPASRPRAHKKTKCRACGADPERRRYKYEAPPADPALCCFDWLPDEMRLHILRMLRPPHYPKEGVDAAAPLMQKDQWAAAMTCAWMRGMVDPMVRRYLAWAAQPHDKSIVPCYEMWSPHSRKYYQLADANDPNLVAFALARGVHQYAALEKECASTPYLSVELVFHAAAAAAGSLTLLRLKALDASIVGGDGDYGNRARWFRELLPAAVCHGRIETIEYLYAAWKASLVGFRTCVTAKNVYDTILHPAVVTARKDVIRWFAKSAALSDVGLKNLENQGLVTACLVSPRPEETVKWVWEELDGLIEFRQSDLCEMVDKGLLGLIKWLYSKLGRRAIFRGCGYQWMCAAAGGHVEILRWAHAQGFIRDDAAPELCSSGSRHGGVVRWVHETFDHCRCMQHLHDYAQATGRPHVLDWIAANDLELGERGESVCGQAIRKHDWELLEWAVRNGHQFSDNYNDKPSGGVGPQTFIKSYIGEVVRHLEPERLKRLYDLGASALITETACRAYLAQDLVEMVKWAIETRSHRDNYYDELALQLLDTVSAQGDLGLCKWLYGMWKHQECVETKLTPCNRILPPCGVVSMHRAAESGHREVLEWGHRKGLFVFDAIHVSKAFGQGHRALAEWIYRQGGEFNRLTRALAATGNLACLRWARETLGAPWGSDVFCVALSNNRCDVADYCYEEGCPFRPMELDRCLYPRNGGLERGKWLRARGIHRDLGNALYASRKKK